MFPGFPLVILQTGHRVAVKDEPTLSAWQAVWRPKPKESLRVSNMSRPTEPMQAQNIKGLFLQHFHPFLLASPRFLSSHSSLLYYAPFGIVLLRPVLVTGNSNWA